MGNRVLTNISSQDSFTEVGLQDEELQNLFDFLLLGLMPHSLVLIFTGPEKASRLFIY